jgi:hypothetical protein
MSDIDYTDGDTSEYSLDLIDPDIIPLRPCLSGHLSHLSNASTYTTRYSSPPIPDHATPYHIGVARGQYAANLGSGSSSPRAEDHQPQDIINTTADSSRIIEPRSGRSQRVEDQKKQGTRRKKLVTISCSILLLSISSSRTPKKLHRCGWNGCPKFFESPKDVKRHVDNVHKHERRYVCPVCPSTMKPIGRRDNFVRHMMFKHRCARGEAYECANGIDERSRQKGAD